MSIYIALLRGINVGGRNLVGMSDLRDMFAALGLADARSLLQSGNCVFRGDRRASPALERLLEVESKKRFGIAVEADPGPQFFTVIAATVAAVIPGNRDITRALIDGNTRKKLAEGSAVVVHAGWIAPGDAAIVGVS